MAEVTNFNETEKKFGLLADILALQKSLQYIEDAMKDADDDELERLNEEHDALTEMADFLGWQFGQLVGYDFLIMMRRYWGIQTSMHNVLQERYYKAQKARYEDCKRGKKFFTPEDRSFIEQHKLLNELHMKARWEASHCREIISDIVDAAFPDAPLDSGWDEHWEEPPAIVVTPPRNTWASVVKSGNT